MQELKAFLDLAQHYWVITLVIAIFIHLIFSRKKSGQSSIDSRTTNSFNPNSRQSNFQPAVNSESTKLEFTPADPAFVPVITALKKGDKIGAIKLLRKAKGLDLVDAKAFIETLDGIKHTFGI